MGSTTSVWPGFLAFLVVICCAKEDSLRHGVDRRSPAVAAVSPRTESGVSSLGRKRGRWSLRDFRDFVAVRTSPPGHEACWHFKGHLSNAVNGRLIADVEGIQVDTLLETQTVVSRGPGPEKQEGPGRSRTLRRRTHWASLLCTRAFVLCHPLTGDVMDTFRHLRSGPQRQVKNAGNVFASHVNISLSEEEGCLSTLTTFPPGHSLQTVSLQPQSSSRAEANRVGLLVTPAVSTYTFSVRTKLPDRLSGRTRVESEDASAAAVREIAEGEGEKGRRKLSDFVQFSAPPKAGVFSVEKYSFFKHRSFDVRRIGALFSLPERLKTRRRKGGSAWGWSAKHEESVSGGGCMKGAAAPFVRFHLAREGVVGNDPNESGKGPVREGRRLGVTLVYSRAGPGPSWYGPGCLCRLDLEGIKYQSVRDIPESTRRKLWRVHTSLMEEGPPRTFEEFRAIAVEGHPWGRYRRKGPLRKAQEAAAWMLRNIGLAVR
uniref:Uncharacterized protein n=1 Tax=Chromera velia CCMP2878 TaxID=1169474 RepID=A0A0G4HDH5_9ALVE|eukprot:Cvel_26523.t1-p1 / transcript=Cvel_26523.t1 / gene=Cvel_26523 / organism=Chromera_velia_CCMP2878 / gene_product=hypothetical protein / transcript_product=hypothetical protein / location=Cvel_scaffold3168:15616-17070(-) / protein_length=485 / sequence_SO=supercontig / SO=protein_coding / is_pseudo=false